MNMKKIYIKPLMKDHKLRISPSMLQSTGILPDGLREDLDDEEEVEDAL